MRKPDVDLVALAELVEDLFPPALRSCVERVAEGGSTQVYRIRRDGETYYLRFAEQPGDSFAPEAGVHEVLRQRGVLVPEVIHLENLNEDFERSIMVTSEITGRPVEQAAVTLSLREILTAAGRDLAIINSLPVDGFGWVRRDLKDGNHLQGQFASRGAWTLEHLDDNLQCLATSLLSEAEVRSIRRILRRYDVWLREDQARLAHGDFDTTHIFQRDGRYTGIIDFGEMRGAEPLYDLGHFRLHDGERLRCEVLPYLLEGYVQVAELPPEYEQRIGLSALLIDIRALTGTVRRPSGKYQAFLLRAARREIAALAS